MMTEMKGFLFVICLQGYFKKETHGISSTSGLAPLGVFVSPRARARHFLFRGEREEDAEKLPVCVYSCYTHTGTGRVGYLIPLFKTPENFQTGHTFFFDDVVFWS
jgi:hypothetical protein